MKADKLNKDCSDSSNYCSICTPLITELLLIDHLIPGKQDAFIIKKPFPEVLPWNSEFSAVKVQSCDF